MAETTDPAPAVDQAALDVAGKALGEARTALDECAKALGIDEDAAPKKQEQEKPESPDKAAAQIPR